MEKQKKDAYYMTEVWEQLKHNPIGQSCSKSLYLYQKRRNVTNSGVPEKPGCKINTMQDQDMLLQTDAAERK